MKPPVGTRPRLSEILLVAVTVSLLVSAGRVFSDWSFLAPLVGAALVAHVVVAIVRRAGWSVVLGAVLSLLGVAGEQLWVHYPHTTLYGLPQEATLRALADDFSGAWRLLDSTSVPLAAQTALVVSAAAITWAVSVLADWAAFRFGTPGEALIPAGIVFVIVAVLGTEDDRILHAGLTVSCAVAFTLAHRREQAPARHEPSSAPRRLLRWPDGLATGTLAVAGGLLMTGALLPVLSDGPLRSWIDPDTERLEPDGVHVVLSPLPGVSGQLLDNPELELFTVESPQRAYWRLTALGSFDGTAWSLQGRYSAATDRLESMSTTAAPVTVVPQTYSIRALAAVWLPAAYQPTGFAVEGSLFEARFEPVSSTLLVNSSNASSDGFDYTVQSAVPRFDPDFLRSLRNDPAEVDETFLAVPENLGPAVGALAAEATAGSEGPYEQALALQNWFREDFEYDLSVAAGHSSSRLDSFLLQERRGYCEQFAGAFAVLGRTLGLPTRVAVGFTPGVVLEEDRPGGTLYSVRGEHAHAWPEVHISGAGWVAFEPTPGRGAPGAEEYTHVPEQQDSAGPSTEPGVALPPPPPPPPSGPEPADPPALAAAPPTAAGDSTGGTALRILALVGLSLAALAGAVVLYAAATVALAGLQRGRRRRWAHNDPGRSTIVTWEEVVNLLRARRIRPQPAETPLEVAQRAAESLEVAPEPWRRLAFCVSAAAYADGPPPTAIIGQAADAAGEITSVLRSRRTPAQRLRALVDPYPWHLLAGRGPADGSGRRRPVVPTGGRRGAGVSRRVARG